MLCRDVATQAGILLTTSISVYRKQCCRTLGLFLYSVVLCILSFSLVVVVAVMANDEFAKSSRRQHRHKCAALGSCRHLPAGNRKKCEKMLFIIMCISSDFKLIYQIYKIIKTTLLHLQYQPTLDSITNAKVSLTFRHGISHWAPSAHTPPKRNSQLVLTAPLSKESLKSGVV